MEVRTFDDDKIAELIKNADPLLKEYIKALKRALEGQKRTTALAIKKLRHLTLSASANRKG